VQLYCFISALALLQNLELNYNWLIF
ncbi:unnamed protein product, partial [Allacma fusca]